MTAPTTVPPSQLFCLDDYLFAESPSQIVIVGELPQPVLKSSTDGVVIDRVPTLDEAEDIAGHTAASEQPCDSVTQILVLALEPYEPQFGQRLGRAVRAFPDRVLLHCTTTADNPGRDDEAFFAFGFRKLDLVPDGPGQGTTVKWFEYRLSQYKPAPDWLNARFWANPERFNLDEDPDDDYEESDEEE